jgi:hypothetical protein
MMKHATPSFLKKLADFKAVQIAIPKDASGYGYNYAPLDTILPIIEPIMAKHGLGYFHTTDFDRKSWRTYLTTTIYEIEGQPNLVGGGNQIGGYISSRILIDDEVTLAKMNKYMVIGSALTYFRRYHLVTMLGLLTDEDNDADSPGAGRSVESAGKKQDYVKTFKGLIEAGRTKSQMDGFYKKYEHVLDDAQKETIKDLISKKYVKNGKK